MELRHFRYFLAVAEELHFGKAAERLHIAQPALSIQIRKLEDALGGPLFHRANRSVSLTEAGRVFLEEARETLERAARAETIVRRALCGEVASIDIGYSASVVYSGIFGKALGQIRKMCPDVEIKVHELSPQSQLGRIMQRQIHLAFMPTLALDIPRELKADLLAEWPMQVVMPVTHPLADVGEVPLDRLMQEPFVTYATAEAEDGLPFFSSLKGFAPTISQHASSAAMIIELVAAGLGVALLPSSLAQSQLRSDVVFRSLKEQNIVVDCSLISWRTEYEPAVRAVREAVRCRLLGSS